MTPSIKAALAEVAEEFYAEPLSYVLWNFPWKEDPSIQMVKLKEPWASRYPDYEFGPDAWACEFLDDLGEEIRKRGFKEQGRKHAVAPIRFSTSSGHGIGKSTLVAWLIMFILDTRPRSMGVVTANTGDQLKTKTWAELGKWWGIAKTRELWDYSNARGNMSLSRATEDLDIKGKWRCDAMTARAENAEAFQGLHAAGATPFYIFDEASGIEAPIWEARFGGSTDGEPMSFDFGNPTRKTGYFFENTAGANSHRFLTRKIDSRTVELTNKPLMEEWRQDWGEDSDLFKVKVRGEFPASGSVQFISTDVVEAACSRPAVNTSADPLVIGVDVARFGENDTVIYPRLGNDARSFPFERFNGLDSYQVAEKVIATLQKFQALGRRCTGLFIDGGGLGAGPVDILRRLGYNPIDINFGSRPGDEKYKIKGDEMWGKMRDALIRGLAIPQDMDLKAQLTQREYGITPVGKISLESKKDMKERMGQQGKSPDVADALALTFARGVAIETDLAHANTPLVSQYEYDPLKTTW